MQNQLLQIPIDAIQPNPHQPRQHFDEATLAELAQSIATHGILQPLIVSANGTPGRYVLHAGERRLRAARLACLADVPCIVAEGEHDAAQLLERALIENIQREDMRPCEEAAALGKLKERGGLNVRELARKVGKNAAYVTQRLLLLGLEPEIQRLVDAGQLPHSEKPVKALLSVPAGQARIGLAERSARAGAGIKAIVGSAERVNQSLAAQAAPPSRAPALALSGASAVQPRTSPRWPVVKAAAAGMCAECNSKPEGLAEPGWLFLLKAADQECGACSLADMAARGDVSVCRECPAVGLLKRVAVAVGATP